MLSPLHMDVLAVVDFRFRGNEVWEGHLGTPTARTPERTCYYLKPVA